MNVDSESDCSPVESRGLSPAAWAVASTAVISFLPTAIWSAVCVYVFDDYDPKFGPAGTFQVSLLVFGLFAAITTGVTVFVLLVFPFLLRAFPLRHAWHAGALCGACAIVSAILFVSGFQGELFSRFSHRSGILSWVLAIALPHMILLVAAMVACRFMGRDPTGDP